MDPMDATPTAVARPSSPGDEAYVKPQPRPAKSPAKSAQIRIQNRRRAYLDRHPEYFNSIEHELADTLLYDSLVRRFQSAEEREKEGRKKGWSRVLEVDLLRGEAKLARLTESGAMPPPPPPPQGSMGPPPRPRGPSGDAGAVCGVPSPRGKEEEDDEEDDDGLDAHPRPAQSQAEGRQRWEAFLRDRFVRGRDDDFDYGPVDENDAYDDLERRDEEDAWFSDEEPGWASDDPAVRAEAEVREKKKDPEGETGIQDF